MKELISQAWSQQAYEVYLMLSIEDFNLHYIANNKVNHF